MSANRYSPHLLVVAEDDANQSILIGFKGYLGLRNHRQLHLEPVAGGWPRVFERFNTEYVRYLRENPFGRVLMVVDGDNVDRFGQAKALIPEDLKARVYILGCSDEPERLTAAIGFNKERIGELLAHDCAQGTNETWGHPMLKHNATEVERLRNDVRPFLF